MAGGHHANLVIPEGRRNATMSRFDGQVIKKYGDSAEAYQCFLDEAAKCTPPLEDSELSTIWHSSQRFYARVQQQDGYVPPEVYNDDTSYKPEDFSDVGQAEVLDKHFSGELRYSPVTHFIRYTEHYAAVKKMNDCGAQGILDTTSKAKAEALFNDAQSEAYAASPPRHISPLRSAPRLQKHHRDAERSAPDTGEVRL